jgi:hypothetical protein
MIEPTLNPCWVCDRVPKISNAGAVFSWRIVCAHDNSTVEVETNARESAIEAWNMFNPPLPPP